MTCLVEKEMNDHQFASWLHSHGWRGDHTHAGNRCEFTNPEGVVLAAAVYDNSKCTSVKSINTTL